MMHRSEAVVMDHKTTQKADLNPLMLPARYTQYVRSRHEKKVAAALEQKGIEVSLPMMQISRRWSDYQKLVQGPLFRSYVFTRISLHMQRLDVLQTPGVVRFAGIGGKISSIPDMQMYWLDLVLSENQEF